MEFLGTILAVSLHLSTALLKQPLSNNLYSWDRITLVVCHLPLPEVPHIVNIQHSRPCHVVTEFCGIN